jgi:hypothetical protein
MAGHTHYYDSEQRERVRLTTDQRIAKKKAVSMSQ